MTVHRSIDDIAAELRPALRTAIADLAVHLKGPPNWALSNRLALRWGAKGAFWVSISGPKQGSCFDHDTRWKGDPLALIMHERGCGFTEAVLCGAAWAGIDTAGRQAGPADHTTILARDAERRDERERKQAKAEAEQANYEATRIARARRLWDAAKPIDGTVAETYLTRPRAIPRSAEGWPDAVRFHEKSRSLILAGTDAYGAVQFVHLVRLTADGRKIDRTKEQPAKRTYGVMAGAFVRLPGPSDGPLQLAEGPETGLSVWAATGAETWLSIGSIARHDPPVGRRVVVCRDDDAPQSPADASLTEALPRWQNAGADIVVATPWPERRGDKSDFNDLIQAGGVEAVRARLSAAGAVRPAASTGPHYPRPYLSGDAASHRLRWAVGGFFSRVERHLEARDWITREAERIKPGVQHDLEARLTAKLLAEGKRPSEAAEAAATRADKAAPGVAKREARRRAVALFGARAVKGVMPKIQIKGAAGLGKTKAVIDEYLRRPGLWKYNISFYTKTLELADRVAADFADGVAPVAGERPRIQVIRGRQSEDLCHPDRLEVIQAATDAQVASIYRAVCHSPAVGGAPASWCPFHAKCKESGYVAQFDTAPGLRIMPHARLILNQPNDLCLPVPDVVIIDESVIGAMVTEAVIDPAALRDHTTYASKAGEEHLIQEAMDVGVAVVAALGAGNDGAVARLRTAGIKPEYLRSAAAAAKLAADNAMPRLWPGMDPKEAKARCEGLQRNAGAAVAALLRQLARDLDRNRDTSTGVEWDAKATARLVDGCKVAHPVIRSHGLQVAVGAPGSTALMLLDADADLQINRRLFGAKIRGIKIPAVRHARVTQIRDATMATSTLTLPHKNGDDAKLRDRIATMVRREAKAGQVLAICTKAVRLKLTGESDVNLATSTKWQGADITHFGRHLGVNTWANFDTVIVAGRLEVPAEVAERQARAIWADTDVMLDLPGEYGTNLRRHDLRHGVAPAVKVRVHPDPRVQILVEIMRENAMGQGIDRLRLIHRDLARPARVLVMSNLPVPGLTVDELVSKDDMLEGGTIWQRAMARMPDGVLPLSPDWLASNLPDLFGSVRTAKREAEKLKGPSANRDLYWELALLRKPGQPRHSRALVRSDVTDPKAALERLLGCRLAEFRLRNAPPPVGAVPVMLEAAAIPPLLPDMKAMVPTPVPVMGDTVFPSSPDARAGAACRALSLRRPGARQDDLARRIGVSRSQRTNIMLGRFGASPAARPWTRRSEVWRRRPDVG
jgi:hypothetical protein